MPGEARKEMPRKLRKLMAPRRRSVQNVVTGLKMAEAQNLIISDV